jgi:DNA-binding transcriptional ArsR family regulator
MGGNPFCLRGRIADRSRVGAVHGRGIAWAHQFDYSGIMESNTAVAALAALAHESRLAVYRLLVQAGSEGLLVGDLQSRTGIPPATLTHHLNALRRAGLVEDTRDGRSITCRADYACMNALLAFLTENCCGDLRACAPTAACQPPRTRRRTTR